MLGPSGPSTQAEVSTQPVEIGKVPNGTSITAGTSVIPGYVAQSNGTVTIFGVVTGTATYLTFTWDGANYFGLFSSTNMTTSAIYCATVGVASGDNIGISAAANTTSGVIRVFFTPSS